MSREREGKLKLSASELKMQTTEIKSFAIKYFAFIYSRFRSSVNVGAQILTHMRFNFNISEHIS